MTQYLLLPIYIDSLYFPHSRTVLGPLHDFSRMPWNDGSRDQNSGSLPLSETLANESFMPPQYTLEAGLHLFWSLPSAFLEGKSNPYKKHHLIFPAVPNRWQVTRSGTTDEAKSKWPEKTWFIEGDYLSDTSPLNKEGVTIPFPVQDNAPPFRYLGRQRVGFPSSPNVPLASDDFLTRYDLVLTAVGYEPMSIEESISVMSFGYEEKKDGKAIYRDPTFAAYYPHCRGVFGLHDDFKGEPSPQEKDLPFLKYDVVGFYENIPLRNTVVFQDIQRFFNLEMKRTTDQEQQRIIQNKIEVSSIKDVFKELPLSTSSDTLLWWESLKKRLQDDLKENLSLASDTDVSSIDDLLCVGSFSSIPLQDKKDQKAVAEDSNIAFGNTGVQALISYLSQKISPNELQKANIFDQLQAVHLSSRLDFRKIDKGLKFQEIMHDEGFSTHPSGSLWGLRLQSSADQIQQKATSDTILPEFNVISPEIGEHLNQLNKIQQAYDQGRAEIESLQYRLFTNWYKYQVCTYPDDDERDDYPDSDEAKYYIENFDIATLHKKNAEIGNINWVNYDAEMLLPFRPVSYGCEVSSENSNSVASQFKDTFEALVEAVRDHNLKQRKEMLITPLRQILDNLPSSLVRGSDKNPFEKHLNELERFLMPKSSASAEDLHKQLESTQNEILKFFQNVSRQNVSAKVQPLLSSTNALIAKFPNLPCWVLHRRSAPRYQQPNDPVVLVTGKWATPSDRYHQKFTSTIWEGERAKDTDSLMKALKPLTKLARLKRALDVPDIEGSSWHPLFLEWEIEYFPLSSVWDSEKDKARYTEKTIEDVYTLKENACDLTFKTDAKGSFVKGASLYKGRSILTPHASSCLQQDLQQYITQKVIPIYNQSQSDTTSIINLRWWEEDQEAVIGTLEKLEKWNNTQLSPDSKTPDVTTTFLEAYKQLLFLPALSQALGGFHESLLTQELTFQIPPVDPTNFDDYQNFTQKIAKEIGSVTKMAPLPLNDFNPLRCGAVKITRLRLVDIFGRWVNILGEGIDSLPTVFSNFERTDDRFILPPRLAQPARLNFRWLDAKTDKEEITHPDTTSICGWILPNNLDRSLMFYENKGKLLGWINAEAQWCSAPEERILSKDIPEDFFDNKHLRKVADYILGKGKDYISKFITALDSALDNIQPENLSHDHGLALLIARPIAVVRATLDLQLKGLPSIDHSWQAFRQNLNRFAQETQEIHRTQGFTEIKFPIRIGEFQQLNDGVVGYWIEEPKEDIINYKNDTFYVCQSIEESSKGIQSHTSEPFNLWQSVDSSPQTLTILMDPRGKIHATCGILPTKSLEIPTDCYAKALQSIEAFFMTAPVFAARKKIMLTPPEEPGYTWSWIQKKNGMWKDTASLPTISKKEFVDELTTVFKFEDKDYTSEQTANRVENIWQELISVEWLILQDPLSTIAQIKKLDVTEIKWSQYSQAKYYIKSIQEILEKCQYALIPSSEQPLWGEQWWLKEGYLKLTPTDQQ